MIRLLPLTAAATLIGSAAIAQSLSEQLISGYQAQGYDFIEVQEGLSQIKVEATRGDRTLEVIYDSRTGAILKQEIEPADADDLGRIGVEYDRRDRDFVGDDRDDDDDRRDDDHRDDDDDDYRDDDDDDDYRDDDDDDDHDRDDDDRDDDRDRDDDDDEDDDDNDDDDDDDDEDDDDDDD